MEKNKKVVRVFSVTIHSKKDGEQPDENFLPT